MEAVLFVASTTAAVTAQVLPDTNPYWTQERGHVALHQAALDASTDTLALLVASHPDDQYTLPAAYLRFRLGVRVVVLLVTRGGGGQNSLGPETGEDLARLRTLESEAGAARLSADVYYLNRPDNGYSRSAEETLEQWGEESTTQDMARLVRLIEPDLVLTTHNPSEGHGHDLALLRVLPNAVKLAADEGFETPGVGPFKVSRLFRGATDQEGDQVTVSLAMDSRDAVRGYTYRRLAYMGQLEHRSQSPGPMEELLVPIVELVPIAVDDRPPHTSLLGGLPDFFSILAEARPQGYVGAPRPEDFAGLRSMLGTPADLGRAAIALQRQLLALAVETPTGTELMRRLQRRMQAVERIILESSGVSLDISSQEEAAPGEEMEFSVWIRNEGGLPVSDLTVEAIDGGAVRVLGDTRVVEPQDSLILSALYQPPDLSEADLVEIFDQDTFEPPLRLRFTMVLGGVPVSFERVMQARLQPAVKVSVHPRTLMLSRDASRVRFIVQVQRKTQQPLDLELRVNPPAGMTVPRFVRRVQFAENEEFKEFTFLLNAPNARSGESALHVHFGDDRLRVGVHKVDVGVSEGLRVGLIRGVDNTAEEILQALIGESRLEKLDPTRVLPILDPDRLHSIVVDIRALRRDKPRAGFARLLEYVKEGGRLIVFYHKDSEFNLDTAGFHGAPYDLFIGKGRVTREDAPIEILVPDHVLFNSPNAISAVAWDGWRQERGLYFPQTYDPNLYEELLEMHDPGFPEERGSLLYAKYGEGDYIYCALSLYRQLKNRHPGACRLFANMISR